MIRCLKNLLRPQRGQNSFRKEVQDYQILTENLRQRIVEVSERMEEQRHDYNKAVATMRAQHFREREELEQKNQELLDSLLAVQEQLQRASKDIGREMMSASLLAKTNNALADLCQAMRSGDAGKLEAVADYLGWNSSLSQIALLHLDALRQGPSEKSEL